MLYIGILGLGIVPGKLAHILNNKVVPVKSLSRVIAKNVALSF